MMKNLLIILFFPLALLAQNDCIPERPRRLVNDYTSTLSGGQVNALEQKLRAYNDTTSTQIAVAIMANTCGDEIKFFATQVAQKWGVGQAQEDNGCIILLSMDDREITIQNGYGLEEYLTDAMTKRVIETVIIPEFKNGNYYAGLDRGTDAIFQVLAGQFEGSGGGGGNSGRPSIPIFAIVIIIFIILSVIRNRRGGGGRGGYRGGGYWIGGFGAGGFGGGSSGGFGGGGFGGFGGGGFGGGGASGSW